MNKATVMVLIVSSMLTFGSTALDLSSCLAADEASASISTKITSISLFKNGLGFINREGELPKDATTVLIKELPVPTLGTFWAYTPGNSDAIQELVAFDRTAIENVPAANLGDVIEANIGQNIELKIGDKEPIQGKIIDAPTNSSLVLFQSGNRMLAINRGDIRQVSLSNGVLKTGVSRTKSVTALQLKKNNTKGKCPVIIQYLAKGITWAPSCVIDITDPSKARLSTKAEIINEIDDLDNVTVNLVAGFPNLQFAEVIDPIAKKTDLAAFINSLLNPSGANRYQGRGAVMAQSVMCNAAIYGNENIGPTYSVAAIKGQAQEGLFFYEKKDISLRKGQHGYYPLFSLEVPYEHIYEWKLGDILNEPPNPNPREPLKSDEIWHSIRLANNGNVPWTTAPAMTKQGEQILGQDIIYYTSPGSKTTVKITQAVDVKAEHVEYETARKRNAANFYNRNYDLVDVQGKLTAVNFKNKDIVIAIVKDISGEIVKMTPNAHVTQIATGLKSVNPQQLLLWELPVKARDKIEIEYNYQIYVAN